MVSPNAQYTVRLMKVTYVNNKENSNILMPGVHSDLSFSYACEKSNNYFLDSTTEHTIYHLFYSKVKQDASDM